MRYTVPAIIAALLIATAGCASTGSTPAANTVTSQPATATTTEAATTTTATTAAATTTTSAAPTTTTATKPDNDKPSGQALIQHLKDDTADAPFVLPLVDAEWKGEYLVLSYQSGDKQAALSLCNYVRLNATDHTIKHIQVIGPTENVLVSTNDLDGGFCRIGNHI